ncbi:formylglycine-generating enzyme family protein [Flexilinea flocculi]|uniref:Formylglycine-generating enzyme n=1 Tax=Flexilinea flocculi TaxID=1678840 RepID=A0A0S7BI89_9CHLR|nr:formylglycine-generating enzyme family protein [Flexilinea flocculi]GAP40106.1 formylglycine-generating enzyme [Flexilinea flocculi]
MEEKEKQAEHNDSNSIHPIDKTELPEDDAPVVIPSAHRIKLLRRKNRKEKKGIGWMLFYGITIGLISASIIWYAFYNHTQKQIGMMQMKQTAESGIHNRQIAALEETITGLDSYSSDLKDRAETLQHEWTRSEKELLLLAKWITPSATPRPTETIQPTQTPLILWTIPPLTDSEPNAAGNQAEASEIPVTSGMVKIPAGNFMMGSDAADAHADEKPLHEVWLHDFWIDKTPVTNQAYQRCVDSGSCSEPADQSSKSRSDYFQNPAYANYPVVNVDWNQANAFCNWKGKRLPTEAEWEKAAKGNDDRIYPWGNISPDEYRVNFDNQIGDTVEVGKYLAGKSPYGVLDMAGNVWEWVSDWYSATYYQDIGTALISNPKGPENGDYRVLRGGSFGSRDWYLRVSVRSGNYATSISNSRGFRCAFSEEK